MNTQDIQSLPVVKPGEIWKEKDNRFERYIWILDVNIWQAKGTWQGTVISITCDSEGNLLGAKKTKSNIMRFGEKKGYTKYRESKE